MTASDDGTARVWDPQLEPELVPLVAQPASIAGAYSDGDGHIVVLGPAGTSTVRSARTGHVVERLVLPATPTAVALDPSGSRLAAAFGRSIVVYDVHRQRRLRRLAARGTVASVAVARDGRVAAGETDGRADVWPAAGRSGRVVQAARRGPTFVAFSSDGARLLTASGDGVARVWGAGQTRRAHPARSPRPPDLRALQPRRNAHRHGERRPRRRDLGRQDGRPPPRPSPACCGGQRRPVQPGRAVGRHRRPVDGRPVGGERRNVDLLPPRPPRAASRARRSTPPAAASSPPASTARCGRIAATPAGGRRSSCASLSVGSPPPADDRYARIEVGVGGA